MTVTVVAGVIIDQGLVLTTQRPTGSHLAGKWEFPGGKIEAEEDPRQALARELHEELGIEVDVGDVLEVTFHRYPSKSVLLLFFQASIRHGSAPPRALGVADLRWRGPNELVESLFPPADVPILDRVRRLLTPPAPIPPNPA